MPAAACVQATWYAEVGATGNGVMLPRPAQLEGTEDSAEDSVEVRPLTAVVSADSAPMPPPLRIVPSGRPSPSSPLAAETGLPRVAHGVKEGRLDVSWLTSWLLRFGYDAALRVVTEAYGKSSSAMLAAACSA